MLAPPSSEMCVVAHIHTRSIPHHFRLEHCYAITLEFILELFIFHRRPICLLFNNLLHLSRYEFSSYTLFRSSTGVAAIPPSAVLPLRIRVQRLVLPTASAHMTPNVR
jgi:hypothetical protein